MLQINYQNQTKYEMDEYVEVFKKIAKYTLKKFNMKGNIELSVTFPIFKVNFLFSVLVGKLKFI